jgi:ABC-2 type transport system permease protein
MEKVKLIILFEYLSRVRRLSFILTTIITPILMLLPLVLSIAFTILGSGKSEIVILDQSGVPGLFESIKQKTDRVTKYTLSQIIVAPDQDIDQFRLAFNSEIEDDSGRAYLVLRKGILDGVSPEYYAGSVGDFGLEILARNINSAVIDHRLARAGLDAALYLKPMQMNKIKVSATGEAQGGAANLAASFIIFMFTFFGIIGYGSQVMIAIIEEKNTRIIEVMASSARPFEMMMGKLIGIGLVGLTQYMIWVIAAIPILFASQSALAARGVTLSSIPISSSLCFIIYFVLGYFLFASLYVIGGALVTDNESGNFVTRFFPIITMIPFFTAPAVIQNPSGTIALVLSAIPFFTPGIMVLRMGVYSPPLWQILLSMLLMVATIAAVIWVAAKIYRTGILIYGKKPGLREIVRWLRYA